MTDRTRGSGYPANVINHNKLAGYCVVRPDSCPEVSSNRQDPNESFNPGAY